MYIYFEMNGFVRKKHPIRTMTTNRKNKRNTNNKEEMERYLRAKDFKS